MAGYDSDAQTIFDGLWRYVSTWIQGAANNQPVGISSGICPGYYLNGSPLDPVNYYTLFSDYLKFKNKNP